MEQNICPVCKNASEVEGVGALDQEFTVSCQVCGKYTISDEACREISEPDHILSAWIRDKNENGLEAPLLTTEKIEIIRKSIRPYSVSEKQLLLLQAIERRTDAPGAMIKLEHSIYCPLARAKNVRELEYQVRALVDRGFITADMVMGVTHVMVTSEGWERLDKARNEPLFSNQCFIAMDFSGDMKPVWENAIKPAINDAGYVDMRVDIDLHNENIVFKIIKEIRQSRFVVADLTRHKNGVYFEAGYALGMGIPVIWTVKKEDAKKSHFDVSQINQIRWNNPEDLKEKLYNFICAIIGERSKRLEAP